MDGVVEARQRDRSSLRSQDQMNRLCIDVQSILLFANDFGIGNLEVKIRLEGQIENSGG
jgi:hypothetical protein